MASPNANAADLSKYVIKLHGTAEQLKAAGAAAGQTHPLLKKTVNPFADPNCQALEVVNTLTGKATPVEGNTVMNSCCVAARVCTPLPTERVTLYVPGAS